MCLKKLFKKKQKIQFPYRKEGSTSLGKILRPVCQVEFWSKKSKNWLKIWMIVDTGADYTLLPKYLADLLNIDLDKDCQLLSTTGIGGSQKVYFYPSLRIRLGQWEKRIPVGFLDKDTIPPLLGRFKALEKFNTLFAKKHFVEFSQ